VLQWALCFKKFSGRSYRHRRQTARIMCVCVRAQYNIAVVPVGFAVALSVGFSVMFIVEFSNITFFSEERANQRTFLST
jgi:hypothetical protein